MPSADKFCKQFGPRSGPTKCRARSRDNLFDTQMVFLKELFRKSWFWKKSVDDKKAWKISSGAWGLNFGLGLHLHHTLCIWAVKALASLHLPSLTFTARHCNKYQNLICWLKWKLRYDWKIVESYIKLKNNNTYCRANQEWQWCNTLLKIAK